MNQQKVPFDKLTAIRLFRAVTIFTSSEFGLQAKLMFAGLIVHLLDIQSARADQDRIEIQFVQQVTNLAVRNGMLKLLVHENFAQGARRQIRPLGQEIYVGCGRTYDPSLAGGP